MIHWFQSKGLLYFVRLGLMAVLTGFNFWLALQRWGWSDADPVIKVSALLVAGVTEIGLFAFLVLFHQTYYAPVKRKRALFGWGLASLACVGVSLYVNIGYFAVNWHDQAGNTLADLLIRALFPMGLLLFFSMIPPKVQKLRTAADVEAEYAGKLAEARMKVQLTQIEEGEKHRRRKERQDAEAELLDMLGIAENAGIDVQNFSVAIDGEYQWNKRGLQRALEGLKLWPPVRETLGSVADDSADETATEESDAMSDSGNHKATMNAEEVADLLGVSVKVAKDMIEPRSSHRYAISGSRKVYFRKPRRGQEWERRVPYKNVLEMQAKMTADTAAKVRAFPTAKPPAELQEAVE